MREEGRPEEEARPDLATDSGADSWSDTQVDRPAGADEPGPVTIPGYRILGKIHQGGQGVVYRAHQFSTKRTVAIKVLREGPYASEVARKRFQREVEIVARLEHPNIVAIFDSGRTREDHLFYVMEYVRGLDLEAHVRETRPSLDQLLRLYLDILDAVHHAHLQGVIHRDLKGPNILVDGEGRPRVLDFGLARGEVSSVESVLSTDGQFVGTVATMSPEQVRGLADEIDVRTDVYALGVILYQLVTGAYPYPVKGQLVEVLRHITETMPVPPSRAWSSEAGISRRAGPEKGRGRRSPVDDDLETIILKAIAKEKERRYADAQAFAEDVRRYLDGRPIAAKRDSGLYVLRKRIGRNRTLVGAIAGATAVAVIAAAWILLREPARPAVDPALLAELRGSEAEYVVTRDELLARLGGRGGGDDAAARQGLEILQGAVSDLTRALERDPENVELHQLLLRTYEKEVALLRRILALESGGKVGDRDLVPPPDSR